MVVEMEVVSLTPIVTMMKARYKEATTPPHKPHQQPQPPATSGHPQNPDPATPGYEDVVAKPESSALTFPARRRPDPGPKRTSSGNRLFSSLTRLDRLASALGIPIPFSHS